jgi:large repetitive protein
MVAGAVVSLTPAANCPAFAPATMVAGAAQGGYTISGNSIAMTTGPSGAYQFNLLATAPARCNFTLTVTPPGSYTAPSILIPAQATPLANSGAPGTALPVQPQAGAPTAPVGTGTTHYLTLELGSAVADVVRNHLPLDPAAPAGLQLRKTGDRAVAEIGDTIRYIVQVRLTSGTAPRQVSIVDRLPAGFSYVAGTALVDGRRVADPVRQSAQVWVFQLGALPASGQATLQYRVRVGVGAAEGDGTNRAQGFACLASNTCLLAGSLTPIARASASNEGSYRVRVAGGVFGDDACVVGKVYVDCNGNHVQDREELGIPGVRLVLQDGTQLVSDSEGKYSVCRVPPRSHVLRLDERTLPRGSRLTTSSNRNLGDAGSLWLDVKRGSLHRGDFIEGSCSNTVLEQVKARRAQGEVRAPETEKAGRPALRFDSKAHEKTTSTSPQQGTDGANQQAPKPRPVSGDGAPVGDERHVPTPQLPMNQPPPQGRRPSDAPSAPAASAGAAGAAGAASAASAPQAGGAR